MPKLKYNHFAAQISSSFLKWCDSAKYHPESRDFLNEVFTTQTKLFSEGKSTVEQS